MKTDEQKGNYEDRAQTIFRVEKNPDNPFVMIDRRVIENPKLSWKAKGLLAYLLSRPDNWVVRFRDLVKHAPDGAHTVRAAMKELRDVGHVVVETEREGGRITKWIYHIHEAPPDYVFQKVEKQEVEKQHVEKRAFNNKDSTKTDSTKKKLIINPITAGLFLDAFGQFNSQKEQERWGTLYDSVGPDRAAELIAWASKKEIHLANRPSLIDALETAAKKWKTTEQRKQTAAQSGDYHAYVGGQYADFIEH
jgi:hypothetical protein